MTPDRIAEIDGRLASWRQGDAIVDATIPFVHLTDLSIPTTTEAERLADEDGSEGIAVVSQDVDGLMVVSQTCDLVRSCRDRPYVEVCPLISLPANQVALVRYGRVPRFVALPGLDSECLVGDLDRVMTIEKGILVTKTEQRLRGVASELEAQILAETLGRKRTRAAFPDDFVAAVSRMRSRIIEKHPRASPEGNFLRSIKEIRVRALPDWTAPVIEVEFLFVFDKALNIPSDADHWIEQLCRRVETRDRIAETEGRAVGLDQISAMSYQESHRLDLDHLSQND